MHIQDVNRFLILISVILLFRSLPSAGQDKGWQEYYDVLIEELDDEGENAELIFEQLTEIAAHPLNLNAITREELESMFFFSDTQTDAILEYIDHYGPVRSKGEIAMIPFLDNIRGGLLSSLTYLGDMPERQMNMIDSLKFRLGAEEYKRYVDNSRSKGELSAYGKIPFYDRKGDIKGYTGYKYKHWLRLNYSINRHLKIGAVASQDAGEPFFYGKNKWGYDYYAAYLQLQRIGFLKKLVVGNYRMRTGLGLILNTNFNFGKTFGIASLHSPASAIMPHSSRSSANFLQGAAATFSVTKQLETTIFGSYRLIDATLDAEGTSIKTIVKTGYHRTESELGRKNNASQTSLGTNINYRFGLFNVGATALWNHYNIPMKPYKKGSSLSQMYKMFYPKGSDFFNVSINYGYKYGKRVSIEGETAADNNGYVATINTIKWQLNRRLAFVGIQRYYPHKFCATMGRSFSEGGRNQDENGVYLGATWEVNARLSLFAYTDAAYFLWPKYQSTGSSHSFDNLLQANYKISPISSLLLRYRIKAREKDDNIKKVLRYKNEQRARLAYTLSNRMLSWKSQIDFAYCKFTEQSVGGMLSETLTMPMKPWKIALGASYFHTKDYNSRVYAYERSTPYNLSFPSFFGHGCRFYALAEAHLLKNFTAMTKFGFTHYFDRNVIGTGLQAISASSQTDLELMIRWKL